MTDRSLRIVHVTATFPPYYGGTGNVCYHNTRVLAARGHDVHVYTAAWPGEVDDPPGVTVHRLRPIVRVGNAPVLPQLARLPAEAIIHLHFPFYAGAEFVALSRRPYVATYHQDVQLSGWLGRLTLAHDRVIGRRVLGRADRLCPTSLDYFRSSSFADLIPPLGDRLVPVPNGVDLQLFRPGPADPAIRRRYGVPEEVPLVLFVGSMDRAHYFKGVPTLLRALARLPKTAALLVGEGDLRPEYERTAREFGIAERVRFAGRVTADELPDLYRAADFLVLPSETRGEAFGIVLIEAMASGRPVVATNLPGVRSVVSSGRDGLLVSPGDPQMLANAIGQLAVLDPAARAEMGMAGRRKVEGEYDWERIGDRLEEMYRDVLQERQRTRSVVITTDSSNRDERRQAQPDLPIELRAALDVIALNSGGAAGVTQGRLIGAPRLVSELQQYAPLDPSRRRLIALGAEPARITADLEATPVDEVVTLVTGPLRGLLKPLQAAGGTSLLAADLPRPTWRAMGYEAAETTGIQGLGAIGWAVGERGLRRLGRPDLADRCRIGMLRTLVAARPLAWGAIRVRCYRRVGR